MSRCFPFPPPGYEPKARPDDVNLIVKEKKHKKHKDKKDKDKKERSDRKEKERSEGKHKEDKKRKRGKHRDKKDKKKDKPSSSEEKKILRSFENQNGEKLVPEIKPAVGILDKRTSPELAKRDGNNGGAMENQMVQKITLVEKTKANLLGKVQENNIGMVAGAYGDIKDKRENGRMANGHSPKVDARCRRNGSIGNYFGENKIKVEGGSSQVDKFKKRKEGQERNGYRNIIGEGDGSKNEKKEKKMEKITGHSNNPSHPLKESRDCSGQLNGILHGKGIRIDNMSRSTPSLHQAGQDGNGFHPSQNVINLGMDKGAIGTHQKVNGKHSSPQPGNINLRNLEPHPTANDSTAKHDKINMLSNGRISLPRVHIERKMESCQTTNTDPKVKQSLNNRSPDEKFPSACPPLDNERKMAIQMDKKEFKMNCSLEGGKLTLSGPSPVSLKAKEAKEKVVPSLKSPHPDLKYLSQILSVPKVEWPQCDDQDWLFGCKDSEKKRPKSASSEVQCMKQVWAEAIKVEFADVTAMPYVIPY